jgi:NAD(P)H-flavin reductase
MNNPYLPMPVEINRITIENDARDIKTFELVFCNKEDREKFDFECGQFAEISILGVGESPIGIASSPLDKAFLQFSVKRYATGVVTTALHNSTEGDTIGIRGPLGNAFPLSQMEGKNVLIIGGGFAVTTLRSTIRYILHDKNRKKFKKITYLYGARNPGELLYKQELAEWQKRDDIEVCLTVDNGDDSWKGNVGLVPNILRKLSPSSENVMCIVCGPPIMVKFTLLPLLEMGFKPDKIITSLEMRMKCGVGKCGRCNIGSKYVCVDGPVFSYTELQNMPAEY